MVAPATAKSGAASRALAFCGVNLRRKDANAASSGSPRWMGGIDVPGTRLEGLRKCSIIQVADLRIDVVARFGAILAGPSARLWQLEQRSALKYPIPARASGGSCCQSLIAVPSSSVETG